MYLLDTNVVSELRESRSGKADYHVVGWAASIPVADLFISVVTVQELEMGVRKIERRDRTQGTILRAWLDQSVMPAFDQRMLPTNVGVVRRAAGPHVPDPRPVRDAFIAATALTHDLTVVTRNVADFAGTGVAIVTPWQPYE